MPSTSAQIGEQFDDKEIILTFVNKIGKEKIYVLHPWFRNLIGYEIFYDANSSHLLIGGVQFLFL